MPVNGLLIRIWVILALLASIVLAMALTAIVAVALSLPAAALPIEPDLDQVLAESERPKPDFPPARAGWNGPESEVNPPAHPAAALLYPAVAREAARRSLLQAVIPDPRVLAAIGIAIVALRRRRKLVQPPAVVHAGAIAEPWDGRAAA